MQQLTNKLKILKKQPIGPLLEKTYEKESSERVTIVIFDIPEKERRKRDWLRAVLKNLGLKMIQKSVWIGKVKIPEALIKDLKRLNLIECVEIFEVSRTGSLEHIA